MAFAAPTWLLAAPPLWLASWWIARKPLGGWPGSRQWILLAVRCLVLTVVCAALAEPRLTRRATEVSVVAVLDVSESVPPEQRALAQDFVEASLQRRRPDDRLGLLTVARDPLVQTLPAPSSTRPEIGFTGACETAGASFGIAVRGAAFGRC